MKKSITGREQASRATYEVLEGLVREKVQEFIQEILEEELTEFLARGKSERLKAVDGAQGYRNGHGKARKFALMSGTITVRRLRVRDTDERFESKVLPLFKRRTKEVVSRA